MTQVTLFSSFSRCKGDVSMLTILNNIHRGIYAAEIQSLRNLRAQGKKEEAEKVKKQLLAFTVSATYRGARKLENITAYKPLVVIDIDHVNPAVLERAIALARAAAYTVACFVSPSGEGLKIIAYAAVGIEPSVAVHRVIYNTVSCWYADLLAVEIDASGSDPGRLCFVSFDPELYLSPRFLPWLNGSGSVPDDLPVLAPVVPAALQATGKRLTNARRSATRRMKYEDGNRNNYVHLFANYCNRLGVKQADVEAYAEQYFADLHLSERTAAIASAYAHQEQYNTAPAAENPGRVRQVEGFLKERYNFRRNIVRGLVEYRRKKSSESFHPLTDFCENSIWRALQTAQINCRLPDLRSILHSDFSPEYHPFEDYFESLPAWDGYDYIGALAATITTTEPEFWSVCFRKWLVATVCCALDKGRENQSVLLLSGEQGLGKTTWLRNLVPPAFRQYVYCGNLDPTNKDSSLMMSDCFLIILDELSGQSRMELNRLKAMITQDSIRERRAYAHNAETYLRRASFCATVNDSQILTDRTGSRRFLCFEALGIDYTQAVNHTGIYSQALALYRSGFRYWFADTDIAQVNANNEPFQQSSPEEELFFTYFRRPERFDAPLYLTSSEIVAKIADKTRLQITSINVNNVGKMLKRAQFEQKRLSGKRLFLVTELTFDQVKAIQMGITNLPEYSSQLHNNQDVGEENGVDRQLPF